MRLLNASMSDEDILFCGWLNSSTVGLVTDTAVYHCIIQKDKARKFIVLLHCDSTLTNYICFYCAIILFIDQEGDDNPKKIFSLNSKLAPSDTCVTDYACDGDMKWSLVVTECQDGVCTVRAGRMELYSVEHNTSRGIVGYLGRLVYNGTSLLLVYVLMSECGSRGRVSAYR